MISDRLATMNLLQMTTVELAQVIQDEAAHIFGADETMIFVHDASQEIVHPLGDDSEINVLSVLPGFRCDSSLPALAADTWHNVATSGFNSGLFTSTGKLWTLPILDLDPDLTVILVMLSDQPLKIDSNLVDGKLPFVSQIRTTLSNHLEFIEALKNRDRLDILYKTAGEIPSQLNIDVVLQTIIRNACQLLGAPIGYIMMVDPKNSQIYMRAVEGTLHPSFQHIRLQFGDGLGGLAAQHHNTFLADDYLNDLRFSHDPATDNAVRREGIKSILGSPLLIGGASIGVLYVADKRVRRFLHDEISLLEGLALHAGLAIQNAQLYERDTASLQDMRKSSEVIQQQNEIFVRSEAAQSRFSATLLAGGGLSGIAAAIHELVGSPVLILGKNHQRLASCGESKFNACESLWKNGLPSKHGHGMKFSKDITLTETDAINVGRQCPILLEDQWNIFPVHVGGEFVGSIWVFLGTPLEAADQQVLELATTFVALEVVRERSVVEVNHRLRRNLVDEILGELATDQSVVNRWAKQLGFQLSGRERLCVIKSKTDLIQALDASSWCLFSANYRDLIVALLLPSVDLRTKLESFLQAESKQPDFSVAILSNELSSTQNYRLMYNLSLHILDLLKTGGTARVIDLEQARILTLLFREGDQEAAFQFVQDCLGDVIARDPSGDLGLVKTLSAYLSSGHRPNPAAKKLHVHVNTVYYRLTMLSDILGDIRSPMRVLDLRIACLLFDLLDISASDKSNISHLCEM